MRTATLVAAFSVIDTALNLTARSRTLALDRIAADGRDWRRLTIAAAACSASVDAALLQRKHALFTGGFLSGTHFGTAFDCVAFFGALLLLNAALTGPLSAIGIFAARRAGLRRRATQVAALSTALLPLAAADFVSYELWTYLGDAFDFAIVYELTGRHLSEVAAVTAPLISRPLIIGSLCLTAIVLLTAAVHRLQRKPLDPVVAPRLSAVLTGSLTLFVLSGVVATGIALSSETMNFGLRRTPSGQVIGRLFNRLTDFDRDGWGLLRTPGDPAPFDKTIYPYALDVPGNGIDENGLAGDLPANYREIDQPPPALRPWPNRPPIILFVLESFRADVVGATYAGRAVTPVLDGLARSGVQVKNAWSHNGFTSQSRFHILTGSLGDRHGTILLDDFKDHGYDVGYFSAQDDSFGPKHVPSKRVDKYYDARQDVDARYTTYTTPGSLAVPFNVLEDRVADYLNARQSRTPLFLYVNLHDTHYPYDHGGLSNLLGVERLDASLISPARRDDLWRTYLNAASNVDAAIGRVIERVARSTGTAPRVIVIGDHGESLFEQGFLGHGYALVDAQTRIPLIVSGLPMRIPVPFGQVDLRDALNDALAGGRPLDDRPELQARAGGRVFQYLGMLDAPAEIGWVSTYDRFTYDFRTHQVRVWDTDVAPGTLVGELKDRFSDLIHTWERLQLAVRRPSGGDQ